MTKYIYIDDTIILRKSKTTQEENAGYGALICSSEIEPTIVTNALLGLKKSPSNNSFLKNDEETIARGYFHASFDSAVAKQHFSSSIITNISGQFHYCYISEPHKVVNQRKALDKAFESLCIGLIRSCEPIKLIVEKRAGISKDKIKVFFDKLYKSLELSVYKQPNLPYSFPVVEISLEDKNVSGLQVCDLILWCVNKHKNDPEKIVLLKKVGHWLGIETQTSIEGVNIAQGEFYVGKRQKALDGYPRYPSEALPVGDTVNAEDLLNKYLIIENCIRSCDTVLPVHIVHLEKELTSIKQQLAGNHLIKITDIRACASLFIRLFDTLPIYKDLPNEDNEKWKKILLARKLASLILRRDLIHGVRVADYILKCRQDNDFKKYLLPIKCSNRNLT